MANPTFSAIDHVQLAMPTGKEDEARRFYVGLLGMTEIEKPAELKKRGGCWFQSGSVQLHLGVENDFRPARKAHPALRPGTEANLPGVTLHRPRRPPSVFPKTPPASSCEIDL